MEGSQSVSSVNSEVEPSRLPSVLPSLHLNPCRPEDVVERTHGNLSFCSFLPQDCSGSGVMLLGSLPLAELQLVCVKTSPLSLKHLDNGQVCVGLCIAGSLLYQEPTRCVSAEQGDLLFCPNDGGFLTTTLCSGIAFQFEPKRLLRTMAVMLGHEDGSLDLSQAHTLNTSHSSVSGNPGGQIGRAHV